MQHQACRWFFDGQCGQDLLVARRLLCLLATQGDPDAQYNLGLLHEDGLGGRQDSLEARRLYGLAAAQGHAGAQSYLASMLYAGWGRGGPKDEAEARTVGAFERRQ